MKSFTKNKNLQRNLHRIFKNLFIWNFNIDIKLDNFKLMGIISLKIAIFTYIFLRKI